MVCSPDREAVESNLSGLHPVRIERKKTYYTIIPGKNIARRTMMEQNKVSEQVKNPEQLGGGEDEQFNAQSLTDHLRDLRSCLIVSLAAIVVGFAASYGFVDSIGAWFFKPLTDVLPEGSSLIFTSYQEGFFFI